MPTEQARSSGLTGLCSARAGASGGCDVESLCPMRGNWDKVNKAIYGALSQVTLADMAVSFMDFGIEPGAKSADQHVD